MCVDIGSSVVLELHVIWSWRFPIPFAFLMTTPILISSIFAFITVTVGKKRWRTNPKIAKQMKAAVIIGASQASFILVYFVYSAIFVRLKGLAQVAFILVLPMIKYAMKLMSMHVSTGIPYATAHCTVSIELFDALCLFKYMQSAGLITSGIGLIIVDWLLNVDYLHKLHKLVQRVKQNLTVSTNTADHRVMILRFMSRVAAKSNASPVHRLRVSSNSIFPKPQLPSLVICSESARIAKLDEAIHESLKECEQIIVLEYIECVVPMFYAIYMIVLFHLPNARFYLVLEHVSASKTHGRQYCSVRSARDCFATIRTCVSVVGIQDLSSSFAGQRARASKYDASDCFYNLGDGRASMDSPA